MDIDAVLRLARPQSFSPMVQFVLTSLSAMFVLALLDFVGAVFAKEWADTRQPWWFVAGLLTFMGLFAFYAASLKTAELSIVTIGWVVFLQVGLLLYERVRYGASLPPLKWAAIVLILTLQAYLVLVPNETSSNEALGETIGTSAPEDILAQGPQ
jgi:multidrug transporter EmrE-like cation transporter